MMEMLSKALEWITDILSENNIPFQATGSLAAKVYGSTRALDDIEINIPEKYFATLKQLVQPHVIFGPQQFHDESSDIFLMTLDYHGQKINLIGADKIKLFNKQSELWDELVSDLSRAKLNVVLGIEVPMIPLRELIAYKTKMARDVDIQDVQEILVKIRGYACKR
jgi:hypothetical protein